TVEKEDKGKAQEAGDNLTAGVAVGTDAAGEMSNQTDAAAKQTQDNTVGKVDKHEQQTSAQRDELQKQHDAEKDKREEQTKSALKTMKDQYGKLHEAGQQLQGPLKQAVEK